LVVGQASAGVYARLVRKQQALITGMLLVPVTAFSGRKVSSNKLLQASSNSNNVPSA
jgi:hypothetical protein